MAGSVNKVILIGNLGKDPEVRHMQDGRPVCNLSVATSETWRDKTSGERREKTEWHKVVIFSEPLCKIAEQYLRKGSKIYLEGQLQTRKYEDKDGQERYTTEVVIQGYNGALTMLDGKGEGRDGGRGFSDGGQMDYQPRERAGGAKSSGRSAGGDFGGGYDRGGFGGGGKGGLDKALDDEIPF